MSQSVFYGNQYDINSQTDSVRLQGVTPIGTDSVFVINIIPSDSAPVIDESAIPDDMEVELIIECNASCETMIEWTDPPISAFIDNCSDLTITQSHYSPLLIKEDQEYVEVIYTATDDCGQTTTASFQITVQCTNTTSPDIPEPEVLIPLASNLCMGQDVSVCPGNTYKLEFITYQFESDSDKLF